MIRSVWSRRLAVSVAAIAGVAAAAGLPEPLAAADASTPHFHADPEASARAAALQGRGVNVLRRIAYKEQLVTGLVERRYGLGEVAREFALVIAEDEVNLAILRQTYAGTTDEVRAARNVIDYVRTLAMPPYELALAVAALQGEFRRAYPNEWAGRAAP